MSSNKESDIIAAGRAVRQTFAGGARGLRAGIRDLARPQMGSELVDAARAVKQAFKDTFGGKSQPPQR